MGLEFADFQEREIFTGTLYFKNPEPTAADLANPYYDGMVSLFLDPEKTKFPTGFLSHVLERLGSLGVMPRLEVVKPPLRSAVTVDPEVCDGMVLRDYQQKCVNTAISKGRGLITAPPRSGKTLMQAAIAKTLGRKSCIFVQRANLLDQHVESLRSWGLDPGVVQGSKFDPDKTHSVAMLQTVWSNLKDPAYAKWLSEIEVMQVDECHHCASSETYYSTVLACPASWRLGFSGTPFSILDVGTGTFNARSWRLVGALGPPLEEITVANLRDLGLMTPVRIVQIRQEGPESVKLIEGTDWHSVYTEGVVNNDDRNRRIAGVVGHLVAAGYLPLVLVSRLDHGSRIFDLLREDGLLPIYSRGGKSIIQCSSSGSEAVRGGIRDAYSKLRKGEANVMIATQVGDEGVDLPEVDSLVLAVGGKSDQVAIQRMFRPLTATASKKSAIVVDFDDRQHGVLKNHSATRRRVYRMVGFDVSIVNYTEFSVASKT